MRNTPKKVLVCLIFCLSVLLSKSNSNDQLLTKLKIVHQRTCPPQEMYSPCERRMDSQPSKCCGYCSCDKDCEVYGDCCLEQYSSLAYGSGVVDNSIHECIPLQYFLDGTNHTSPHRIWMVTKCKSTTIDDVNIEMCINPGDDAAMDSIVPVTDLKSMTHYKNRFCALCNGIGENSVLVYWEGHIHNDQDLLVTDRNLLSTLQQQHGNILFELPNFVTYKECLAPTYSISKCNVTGAWTTYDEAIELGCDAFVDPFNLTYKNYFCYQCNTQPPYQSPFNWTCKPLVFNIETITPNFFAILDVFETDEEAMHKKLSCNTTTQFADYKKMICRDVQCHENTKWSGGWCVPNGQSSPACYETFLKLTWLNDTSPIYVNDTDRHVFGSIVEGAILHTFPSWIYYERFRFQVYLSRTSKNEIAYIVVYFAVKISAFDSLLWLDGSTISVHFHRNAKFRVNNGVYNIIHEDDISFIEVQAETGLSVDLLHLFFANDIIIFECLEGRITLTKVHVCPFISLDSNETSLHFDNKSILIDEWSADENKQIILSMWLYEVHGPNVRICLDTFIDVYSNMQGPQIQAMAGSTSVVEAKRIVSFVCVCLSIMCLCIVIITYLKLPVLRSQPGINNMILCIFLFLAQVVYQFGAGQRSVPSWACALIGAVCHFLWLAVMFSMNACSLHMFSIFKTRRKIRPNFSLKYTVRYLLYIISMSVLFVLINLIISFTFRNDNLGGYGGKVCYISSNLMQIIAFLFPAAATLSVNFLLFSYVVFRISKDSFEASQLHQERSYFLIYVRLSTLTGLTWIVGFIHLFLSLEILEYIFIILNASQGVFIMIAFVMNKRVYSLCCVKEMAVTADKIKDQSKTSS